MKITKEELKKLDPCEGGFKFWIKTGEEDLIKFMRIATTYGHFDWGNWLFVRMVSIEQRVKYAIFAAKSVLHIFEEMCPKDDRPRRAIQVAATTTYTTYTTYDAARSAAADTYDAAYARAAVSAADPEIKEKLIDYAEKLLES